MATLSIRARRTKDNPFPHAQPPLARWGKGDKHYALRADGSVVCKYDYGTWSVITLRGKPKKGLTVDEVHEMLTTVGYIRESAR